MYTLCSKNNQLNQFKYIIIIKINSNYVGRGQEYSDEDEEFSSGEEASDSEPTLEDRRRKKNITTGNARVKYNFF